MFSKIKNWFHNYWYYYKWGVIIAAIFITIILICVFQSASKEEYDVSVIYTGPKMLTSDEKNELMNAFEMIMDEDYNNDGKKVVDLVDIPAFTDEQIRDAVGESASESEIMKYAQYTVDSVRSNFSSIIFAGDISVCLLDEYWYNILYETQVEGGVRAIMPLEEILGYKPDNLRDEYSIYLSDLDIYDSFGAISRLPEDTIVCFRRMSAASAFTGKKQAEKMYEYSSKLLRSMFNFKVIG